MFTDLKDDMINPLVKSVKSQRKEMKKTVQDRHESRNRIVKENPEGGKTGNEKI